MQIKNSKSRYGMLAILFHWSSALAVVGLFFLGWWMVRLDYYDPWYSKGPFWHKGIGVFFTFWLLLRILWKLINPKPEAPSHSANRLIAGKKSQQDKDSLVKTGLAHKIIELVHVTLYILLILILVTGFMIVASDSRPLDVLGLFSLPVDWLVLDKQETVMGNWHRWLAYVLSGLVVLHVLGALKHYFIDKDNTLQRMIGISK